MAVTIKDIQEKEFKRKVRGYDDVEVDDFLDEITDEMERLISENQRLVAESREDKNKAENSNEELGVMKTLETTLRDTLVHAQRTADDVVAEAQKRAKRIVESAEEQASRIVGEAREEADRVRGGLDAVKKQAADFRVRYNQLIEEQVKVLKMSETLTDGDD